MKKLFSLKYLITAAVLGLLLNYQNNLYADVIYIENGGVLSLEIGEKADIEFEGFNNKEIKLTSTDEDKAQIYFGPIKEFIGFQKGYESFKGITELKVGEEVIFYETKEMLVVFTLEEILKDSVKIKVKFGSAPPAPKILPGREIKITLSSD